jgi:hypothetical protein
MILDNLIIDKVKANFLKRGELAFLSKKVFIFKNIGLFAGE